jgi:hypothetical protein
MVRDTSQLGSKQRAPAMMAYVVSEGRLIWHELLGNIFSSYRPELHYMRGPGPKWRAKHRHEFGLIEFCGPDGDVPARRQAEHRLQLSLAETHRDGDTVRHEHVGSLGVIATPPTVADRAAFWEQLIKRLAALGERVDYAAVIAAIAARVPAVTDAERHAIPPPNVKPDATAPAECAGVLGIDPGFGGALALYRGPGDWVVIDVPTMGKGKQRELDGATFAAWLREHRPVKAFIEYAAARPGQGHQGPTRNARGWRCGSGRTKPSSSVASVTTAEPRQC